MPHGVDAVVQPMQPALLDPPRDRAIVEPAGGELIGSDVPQLSRGNARDTMIGGGCAHVCSLPLDVCRNQTRLQQHRAAGVTTLRSATPAVGCVE